MEYVFLGSGCGVTVAFNDCGLLYKQTLPFNWMGSTFYGVIDCIENDFANFFPKDIKAEYDKNLNMGKPFFRSDYFIFWHHNLLDNEEILTLKRRIQRFQDILKKGGEIIFIRAVATESKSYEDEIKLAAPFIGVINRKYPSIKPVLLLLVPEQDSTNFVATLRKGVFLFTLKSSDYKPIFDYIRNNDLFANTEIKSTGALIKKINIPSYALGYSVNRMR